MNTKQLKEKILSLAIQGKLVPQDPNDEPAIELLKRINPNIQPIVEDIPFEIPKGWEWIKIKDVFLVNPKNKAEDQIDAGFVPMANISEGYSSSFKVETKKWKDIKKGFTHFANGDVAVAKISPCFENRKSVVFCDLPGNIGAGTTELHVFRPLCVEPYYALYFFKTEYFINQCVGTFIGNVGQQRVGKNVVEEIYFPLPPLKEQKHIADKVESLFTLIDTIENDKESIKENINVTRQKLLSMAIRGELVPQDPNDEPAIELLKRINPKFTSLQYDEQLPQGWSVCAYNDIFLNIPSKPFQILQTEIQEIGKYPVVSQSANYIEGYSNRECILKHDKPYIIFGDHTRVVKYVDFDFIVGADGVKIINPLIYEKYGYYILSYATTHIEYRGYARHFSKLSKYIFLLPPLAEQRRIVEKLELLFSQLDYIEKNM